MNIYIEYAVTAQPSPEEKWIRNGLWAGAFGFLVLSFFSWFLILGAVICVCGAYAYGTRLLYEYEYILCRDELSIDKVIQGSARKSLAKLDLAHMELITNERSRVEFQLQSDSVKKRDYSNPSLPQCWIVMNEPSGTYLYTINVNEEMLDGLKKEFPIKSRFAK